MNAATQTASPKSRLMPRPVARERVYPGGHYWYGALVLHKGHPAVYQCSHRHTQAGDARDCAEALLHIPHDSPLGEQVRAAIAKATGAA